MTRHYLIALMLLGSLVAFAQTADIRGSGDDVTASGNAFLRVCGKASMTDNEFGYCHGYVYGVTEMFAVGTLGKHVFCEPNKVTRGQEYDIVVKFIRDNPKLAHAATANLIQWAMIDAFPCPKK